MLLRWPKEVLAARADGREMGAVDGTRRRVDAGAMTFVAANAMDRDCTDPEET